MGLRLNANQQKLKGGDDVVNDKTKKNSVIKLGSTRDNKVVGYTKVGLYFRDHYDVVNESHDQNSLNH